MNTTSIQLKEIEYPRDEILVNATVDNAVVAQLCRTPTTINTESSNISLARRRPESCILYNPEVSFSL